MKFSTLLDDLDLSSSDGDEETKETAQDAPDNGDDKIFEVAIETLLSLSKTTSLEEKASII